MEIDRRYRKGAGRASPENRARLPDGANIVFTCSCVEDPERKPAVTADFRGGRYISAEASARGEWARGGSPRPGFDAYATSKQCELATLFALAAHEPVARRRYNAVRWSR